MEMISKLDNKSNKSTKIKTKSIKKSWANLQEIKYISLNLFNSNLEKDKIS